MTFFKTGAPGGFGSKPTAGFFGQPAAASTVSAVMVNSPPSADDEMDDNQDDTPLATEVSSSGYATDADEFAPEVSIQSSALTAVTHEQRTTIVSAPPIPQQKPPKATLPPPVRKALSTSASSQLQSSIIPQTNLGVGIAFGRQTPILRPAPSSTSSQQSSTHLPPANRLGSTLKKAEPKPRLPSQAAGGTAAISKPTLGFIPRAPPGPTIVASIPSPKQQQSLRQPSPETPSTRRETRDVESPQSSDAVEAQIKEAAALLQDVASEVDARRCSLVALKAKLVKGDCLGTMLTSETRIATLMKELYVRIGESKMNTNPSVAEVVVERGGDQ